MTQYLENKVLDGTLKATTYTAPANVYMALYSTTNTATTPGDELTGNNYSRQLVTFNSANAGISTGNANVTFSATGNTWPTAISAAIMDASTSGNMLYFGSITPKAVAAGDTLVFDGANIVITIS
jgi:hypothetical protein